MHIPDFKLERYFAQWEFKAPYLLCSSDVDGYQMSDLLQMADDQSRALWHNLSLGYTESAGHPLLRAQIANLYTSILPEEVVTFAGGEEAIFVLMNTLLNSGDHAIVTWPGYQSLYAIAQSVGADISLLRLHEEQHWQLDIAALRRELRPNTRLIVINFPHNPTGAQLAPDTFAEVMAIAHEAHAYVFSDESYRLLEYQSSQRLPAAADQGEHGISLGVMSKSYALAGLRVGWLATHDKSILQRASAFKDYISICNSAPSEILTLIALRSQDQIIARSLDIIQHNLEHLDLFFAQWSDIFDWQRPQAGSIAFPRLRTQQTIADFTRDVVEQAGVLLLPGTVYDHPGNHFRIGFGRKNMPEALQRLDQYLKKP